MSANEYIVGQVVVLKDVITDPSASNALTDDGSDVVTVYKPDGSTATPAVIHASLGTYTAQITTDAAGWWEYVWKSTGAGAGASRNRLYVAPVP